MTALSCLLPTYGSRPLRIDRGLIVAIENASYILESVGRQIQSTNDESENIAQLFFSFAKTEGPTRAIFSWANKDQMITVSNNLGVLDKPIDISDRDYVKKAIAEGKTLEETKTALPMKKYDVYALYNWLHFSLNIPAAYKDLSTKK